MWTHCCCLNFHQDPIPGRNKMIFISNYALQTYYLVAVGILEEIQKEAVFLQIWVNSIEKWTRHYCKWENWNPAAGRGNAIRDPICCNYPIPTVFALSKKFCTQSIKGKPMRNACLFLTWENNICLEATWTKWKVPDL